jgi:thiamine pyrophosphokinase
MSSHHIVRDNQEPALIIANGEACSLALMHELMEWAPKVVVLDGALPRVLELGLKVDVWLGDFDSGAEEELLKGDFANSPQLSHIQRVHTPDQEFTDLQKAFHFLLGDGFSAVNVVWATGRRQDHHFNNIFTLARYSDRLTINFLDDYGRVFASPKKFKKWYPKNTDLSLIPCGKAVGVTTQNLVWNLNNETLELPDKTSSSNRVSADGFVEIEYIEGHLLIMECWDKREFNV